MTKKELTRWLLEQKLEKMNAAAEKCKAAEQAIIKEWQDTLQLDEFVSGIQTMVIEIHTRLGLYFNKLGDRAVQCGSNYDSLSHRLNRLGDTKERLIDAMKVEIEMPESYKQRVRRINVDTRLIRVKIAENYDNVILAVQSCKTAAVVVQYLEGLGFDLSELKKNDEQPITTALAAPVDVNFLFLPKKEGN